MQSFSNFLTERMGNIKQATLDNIISAPYSASFMNTRGSVSVKDGWYEKIGKNKWQFFSSNNHSIGRVISDKDLFDILDGSGEIEIG